MMGMILLLVTAGSYAQEKTKKVTNSYNVGNDVELTISYTYGMVHVETWDRNQIAIEITVTAELRSESRSQELLDKIDFDITETSSIIEYRTRISGNINTKGGENFSIDYEVKMPKANDLSAKLSYGNMYVDDLSGKLEIDLAYGNLKGDMLTGDFTLDMAYSNGDVDALGSGTIDIAYGNLKTDAIGDVDIDNRYSNLELGDAKDIGVDMRYGTLKADEAANMNIDMRYSTVNVGYLSRSITADMQYGGGVNIGRISRDFTEVEIDGGYAGADLTFESGVNAKIEGKFRYGGMKYDEDVIDFTERIKENNSASYRGTIGSGNGGAIRLEASYGTIRLRFD
jgi:hypothetical protein